jgi:hypothetical protein
MRIGKNTVLLLLLFMCFIATKQAVSQVTVQVKMDTSMMLIGDQTYVTFESVFPDTMSVNLPVFADTIIDKLEIVSISNIDTLVENERIKISQKYLVTSFDSGWYVIPPLDFTLSFPQVNRLDTLRSVPVYFGVLTMPIDTANADAITDIKAPIEAPITFKELVPYLGIGFGVLLLLFLAYLIYLKWSKKEPLFVKKEKPKEPAHLVAFRDLDNLKKELLWQKGLVKEYHSRLTEVLRVYIEDRFDILAMESTTDEIIGALKSGGQLDKELNQSLFNMLSRADFVKFAKASPLADENEQSLTFAYQFVNKTKPVEVLENVDEDNKLENAEKTK